MNRLYYLASTLLFLLVANTSAADTLELADGTIMEGDFVGSSNGIVMFNAGDSVEAFPESQVVGIYLSEGVATSQALAAAPVPPAITAPAGTRLVIRMADSIDTKRHKAGHKFRGQLEGAIVVNGITVAPRGRVAGKSALAMEFTDIMIDDQLYPLATGTLSAQTSGEAGKTVRRSARAAAMGGLIDGKSGARTGMKVGAGVSLLTSGESINIPAGTLLETSLRVALTVT